MIIEEIESVKEEENYYIVNENICVPKVDGNSEYEVLKEWLKTNEAQPQYSNEEIEWTK